MESIAEFILRMIPVCLAQWSHRASARIGAVLTSLPHSSSSPSSWSLNCFVRCSPSPGPWSPGSSLIILDHKTGTSALTAGSVHWFAIFSALPCLRASWYYRLKLGSRWRIRVSALGHRENFQIHSTNSTRSDEKIFASGLYRTCAFKIFEACHMCQLYLHTSSRWGTELCRCSGIYLLVLKSILQIGARCCKLFDEKWAPKETQVYMEFCYIPLLL